MRYLLHILTGVALSIGLLSNAMASDLHSDESEGLESQRATVYTTSNAASGNQVLAFSYDQQKGLIHTDSYDTGGLGTDSGLGNQGGLVLGEKGRFLFVVNAGSNQISVFAVHRDGHLVLRDTVDSGGLRPVSLAVDRGLLYVLNANSDNITGFRISRHGKLYPLSGSTRPLSGAGTAPAQVGFNPEGNILVVTEKATNNILTYRVEDDGLTYGPFVHTSSGVTPFGFSFDQHGRLYVSNAAGGAADASSLSSYEIMESGDLQVISDAVPSTETAACWVAIPRNGRFAYTTNTGSGTLTGYRIARKTGTVELLNPDGVTGIVGPGSAPIDLAFSRNNRLLFALGSGTDSIGVFRVQHSGALQGLPGIESLPPFANGMAAR